MTLRLVFFVIASQRVRPEVAGPMTGSAKQSSAWAQTGLLRRFAPRNDDLIVPPNEKIKMVLVRALDPEAGHRLFEAAAEPHRADARRQPGCRVGFDSERAERRRTGGRLEA